MAGLSGRDPRSLRRGLSLLNSAGSRGETGPAVLRSLQPEKVRPFFYPLSGNFQAFVQHTIQPTARGAYRCNKVDQNTLNAFVWRASLPEENEGALYNLHGVLYFPVFWALLVHPRCPLSLVSRSQDAGLECRSEVFSDHK